MYSFKNDSLYDDLLEQHTSNDVVSIRLDRFAEILTKQKFLRQAGLLNTARTSSSKPVLHVFGPISAYKSRAVITDLHVSF